MTRIGGHRRTYSAGFSRLMMTTRKVNPENDEEWAGRERLIIARFTNPRQFMAYVGLVPSEHSSGRTRRQGGGITKAGNGAARLAQHWMCCCVMPLITAN
jgi:transposase